LGKARHCAGLLSVGVKQEATAYYP
jgi:hypothetical protein